MIGIEEHSYWVDEALEVRRAQMPWPRILALSAGPDPPLFRLLLAPLASRTTRELWLRLPSALFGAGAVYLGFRWVSLLGDPRLGLLTAGLLAAAPVLIYYGQEVSQYSLAVLLALVSLLAFERAGRFGRARDWVLVTLASVAAVGSYYGLGLLLPALDLDLAWRTWRAGERRRWVGFAVFRMVLLVLVVLLYRLMLAEQISRFTSEHGMVAWLAHASPGGALRIVATGVWRDVARFLVLYWNRQAPDLLAVLPASLVVVGGAALLVRGSGWHRPVLLLALALATIIAANGLGLYPLGLRYALFLGPLFFLLLAAGLQTLARWPAAATLVAAALAATLVAFWPNLRLLPNPWLDLPYENLRPVLDYVDANARDGDAVCVYYGARPAFSVYRPRPRRPTLLGLPFRAWLPQDKARSIAGAASGHDRVWIVMSHVFGDEEAVVLSSLQEATPPYQLVDEMRARGAVGALFECVPPPA